MLNLCLIRAHPYQKHSFLIQIICLFKSVFKKTKQYFQESFSYSLKRHVLEKGLWHNIALNYPFFFGNELCLKQTNILICSSCVPVVIEVRNLALLHVQNLVFYALYVTKHKGNVMIDYNNFNYIHYWAVNA